jgi:small subunit ribosomal protein S1
VPGEVIKLVPFGAFVRVEEGIQALVHITELAKRHVEVPEQVLQVGDSYMFEVIDIDPDRRRISLSLKQANEGTLVNTQFDPSRYERAPRRRASTSRPASGRKATKRGRRHTPRRTHATSSTSPKSARPPRPTSIICPDSSWA